MLRSLDSAKNEKDRQRIGESIAKKFGQDYWQENESSFLTFALTCFDHYYFLDEAAVDKMHKTSMTLYSRAIIGAAISVMSCLIHRVVDPYFIKDYLTGARNYPFYAVMKNIEYVYQADLEVKGIGSPALSGENILKQLVFKLIH